MYADLDARSMQIAATLRGDRRELEEARVAFLIPPGADYVAVLLGIWRAGGIAVPLPVTHPPAELAFVVRDSDASIVIATPELLDKAAHAAGGAADARTIYIVRDGKLLTMTASPARGSSGSV